MDNSQSNGANAPPAEEQVPRVEETAGGGNSSEGNPPGAGTAPSTQVQPQTVQNTAQGDSATPLETGTRQHTDAERQRAAETKAAREAALTELNRERQQKRIRDAQELTRCLSTGMGLLTPEQVRQITNTVTGTNNEPMDILRSFNERLETLIERTTVRQTAHANEAQCQCTTASQGTTRHTASQTWQEHAAAKTGSVRFTSRGATVAPY